jgi:serine/threonine-protein kinase RsbW
MGFDGLEQPNSTSCAVQGWSIRRHKQSRLSESGSRQPGHAKLLQASMATCNPTSECSDPNCRDVVCVEVPGKMECRDVVLRAVSAACKLATPATQSPGTRNPDMRMQVVSAAGEAYNNIVLHGYAGRQPGSVQMRIQKCLRCVRVEIKDTGVSFDPTHTPPPDLPLLPESGLGIFLMRSMVDELSYVAGCPNVLTLVKHFDGRCEPEIDKGSLAAGEVG